MAVTPKQAQELNPQGLSEAMRERDARAREYEERIDEALIEGGGAATEVHGVPVELRDALRRLYTAWHIRVASRGGRDMRGLDGPRIDYFVFEPGEESGHGSGPEGSS